MPSANSLKCSVIGGRTDNAGTAVNPDWDQEEMRLLPMALLRQGLLANAVDGTPNPNGFRPRQNTGTDLNLLIGSTVAQRDLYLLRGNVAGQGGYLVRQETATILTSVPTADPTNPARYGVYLWIDDATYSGTAARAQANLSCIRGTPAPSPVTPTALATWSAYALLWEFQLPALASAITNVILDSATSFDRRVAADLLPQNSFETRIFL